MKKLFVTLFFISIAIVVLFPSCDGAADKKNVGAPAQTLVKIIDYHNGLYYFDGLNEDFANKLSAFIGEHPELELGSMVANGSGAQGDDKGYFVYFKASKK